MTSQTKTSGLICSINKSFNFLFTSLA